MALLDGDIADIANDALAFIFLDATLTRDVPGVIVDPADPPPPTQAVYTCKAIEQEYGSLDRSNGLVRETDIQVLILAKSFKNASGVAVDLEPDSLDRIVIPVHGVSATIIAGGSGGMPPVKSDPARATWLCRCRS